jgi:fatty-acid desaturase
MFNEHRRHHRWFFLRFPLALIFIGVISLVLMLLWNALLPAIFGIASITYWQALGLFFLSKILFGGFGRGPHAFYHRYYAHRKMDRERNWPGEEYPEEKAPQA